MIHTLIISPHCDDEILGCGGIIHNRQKENKKVFVHYLGIDEFHVISNNERRQEVQNVADFLGFEYSIGSNKVNNYERNLIINQVTDLINQLEPTEIFIPNPAYNQDHQEVYDACLVALRPHDKNHFVKNVYLYEVDQYQVWAPTEFIPNYFEEIDIEKKTEAYKLHASQVRGMRPPEMLKSFANIRGFSIIKPYAEGFVTLRSTR